MKKGLQAAFVAAGFLTAFMVQAETLKLGVVGGMTGPGAPWGLAVDGGVKIAVDEVNKAGGLDVKGKKYQVEVIAYDDHYKAADAVTATNRLIDQDDVKFIIGPIGSASVMAMKPITERNKVVLLSNSYSTEILDANTKYLFRVLPTTNEYNGQLIGWLKKNHPELKRVAILSPNDATGWSTQKTQKKAYEDAGYTVAEAKFFERSQNDFRTLLTSILAKNVDFIELDTVPPGPAGIVIRQAREMGFKGKFTKFGGNNVAETVKSAGADNAEGTLVYLSADPASAPYARLSAEYAKFHSNSMDDFAFYFYDATKLLFKAMQAAGTVTDTSAIVNKIESSPSFEGIQGSIVWGGKEAYGVNHQIATPAYLGIIKGGKAQVVEKFDAR
ncbi:ABC transporter substrate-binding protein [Bordetella genomosp. 12]|uniref:ABC transporter substrate-binding protein n=1 Tax=Bordetella genomosp. 12 TaxID=463035 RepID=A0A261VNT5_9BORD|nr:ABC transporter substrate-binding protein [Bordetella genomosp. 12]OZI74863.1 ABC transporter substrate-binding protein [Bordetella genomosp. 12]